MNYNRNKDMEFSGQLEEFIAYIYELSVSSDSVGAKTQEDDKQYDFKKII